MRRLVEAGLGLDYGVLNLVRVPQMWAEVGSALAGEVADVLGSLVVAVEHIGSTAVPGLMAKPIIDLAIGYPTDSAHSTVERKLTDGGWIYRGDSRGDGGHLFVAESEPWVRVAHAHGVLFEGTQWNRYIQFRDRLRSDPEARHVYSDSKMALLGELGSRNSRQAYTERKTPVVLSLLSGDETC